MKNRNNNASPKTPGGPKHKTVEYMILCLKKFQSDFYIWECPECGASQFFPTSVESLHCFHSANHPVSMKPVALVSSRRII